MKKKIAACLTISIVMCFTMAFPVSAAVIPKSNLAVELDPVIDAVIAAQSTYFTGKYYMVFYAPSEYAAGSTFQSFASGVDYLYFFIYSTPTVSGVQTLTRIACNIDTLGVARITHYNTTASIVNSTTFRLVQNSSGTINDYNFLYFLSDRSTASLSGYDLSDDWSVSVDNPPVDISALQSFLSQAKAIQSTGYRISTWNNLQSAIVSAENLLSTSGYTQSQIDAETDNLQSAINGLQFLPDATDLEDLLVEADQIQDVGYTPVTWSPFATARTSSRTLLAGLDYTTPQVQTSYSNLSVSMTSLSFTAVTPPYVPTNTVSQILTGNVLPLLEPTFDIFVANVMVAWPIFIGIFTIILAIAIIPKLFKRIVK